MLASLKRYASAIACYDRALELRPNDYWAWYQRGNVLEDLSRTEEAIASYDKALEIKPNDYWAWYRRGEVPRYARGYEAAIESYRKALEIWYRQGLAWQEIKNYPQAIACWKKASAIKPHNAKVHYQIVCCYASDENIANYVDLVVEFLRNSLSLDFDYYQTQAAKEAKFAKIRDAHRFYALMNLNND